MASNTATVFTLVALFASVATHTSSPVPVETNGSPIPAIPDCRIERMTLRGDGFLYASAYDRPAEGELLLVLFESAESTEKAHWKQWVVVTEDQLSGHGPPPVRIEAEGLQPESKMASRVDCAIRRMTATDVFQLGSQACKGQAVSVDNGPIARLDQLGINGKEISLLLRLTTVHWFAIGTGQFSDARLYVAENGHVVSTQRIDGYEPMTVRIDVPQESSEGNLSFGFLTNDDKPPKADDLAPTGVVCF